MSATNVHALPGIFLPPPAAPSLNLTQAEVVEASGGYHRAADQLRALHARGFTRAFRRGTDGKIVLERAHYEAVTRGQYGSPAANEPATRAPIPPNREGLRRMFAAKGGR